MSDSKFSLDDLEGRTYRDLQQLAKSLCLPSNVKKKYLIELIHAKKFKTASELEEIVQSVKLERQRLSQVRKRATRRRTHLQDTEISSTNNSQSPPIASTPKRPGQIVMQCSTYNHHSRKYPRQSLLRLKNDSPPISNDRVLRSFNLRKAMHCNRDELISFASVPHRAKPRPAITQRYTVQPKETIFDLVRNDGFPKVYVKGLEKGRKVEKIPKTKSMISNENGEQTIAVQNTHNTLIPARRNRLPSGIYPIANKEPTQNHVHQSVSCSIQSIGFRHSDGRLSKINALVRKNVRKDAKKKTNYRNLELTVQDLINSNIDAQNMSLEFTPETNGNPQYPNMLSVSDAPQYMPKTISYCETSNIDCMRFNAVESYVPSVYNQNFRDEQIRYQRSSFQPERVNIEQQLPNINEVFSRFNMHGRDVTQPIYVQVSEQAENFHTNPTYMAKTNTNNTTMLERLYNLRSEFIPKQSLLQIANVNATRYAPNSTILASAFTDYNAAKTSTVACNRGCKVSSFQQDSSHTARPEPPRMHDFLAAIDNELASRRDIVNDVFEEISSTPSSLNRSQELGSSATIPEMVEDAMEIISQDGDYMERIEMDVRMQCLFCSWAGPRVLLEFHVRKILSSELVIKSGTITVYNKVSGQPFTWSGEIQPLPPSLPYYTDHSCLKLDISSLDLLPNSANLKLINRELVIKSPSKVVVGHPVLDDIHITVFVKILD